MKYCGVETKILKSVPEGCEFAGTVTDENEKKDYVVYDNLKNGNQRKFYLVEC